MGSVSGAGETLFDVLFSLHCFFRALDVLSLAGGLENMKDNKVFYGFAQWFLCAFLFLPLSSPSSIFSLSIYLSLSFFVFCLLF